MATRRPAAPEKGVMVLAPDEVVLAERVDDEGDRIVVTSAGRKLAVAPDGKVTVLVGPPLDAAEDGA